MYIIKYKDGVGYVNKDDKGRHTRATRLEDAFIFETEKAAANYIINGVPKLFRNKVEVVGISNQINTERNDGKTDETTLSIIKDTPFNTLDFDWKTYLEEDSDFRKNLAIYKSNLPLMLYRVDSEICDIEHWVEFNNFNAFAGYKMCKLLKEKRQLRRKIKNEMKVLEFLYQGWIDDHDPTNVLALLKRMENREYEPRVLKELFND